MSRKVSGDIWVLRARLQCAGCEDVAEVRKDISFPAFLENVQAFARRHEGCPKQGTLPEAEE